MNQKPIPQKRASSWLEKLSLTLLFLAVCFAALAQGVVEAWSVAVLELISVLLLGLWAVKRVAEKRLRLQLPDLLLPVIGLVALGLLHGVAITGSDAVRHSLSMDVDATRRAVTMMVALLVYLLVAVELFANRRRLRGALTFLTVYGVLLAMFALVQHFTWNGKFYWFKPNTNGMSPFGPFVSHNHFAGYMEMLIPLAAALALRRGQRFEARLFYGFAAAMMATAVVASLSRGGMISLAATLVFLVAGKLWMTARQRRERHADLSWRTDSRTGLGGTSRMIKILKTAAQGAALAAVVGIVVVVGLQWVGPDRLASRIEATGGGRPGGETFFASRGWIWRDTWTMIKQNPVFGVGIGAFQTAYPLYSESDGGLLVGQAHNDYLQILADAGLVGGALALWFVGLVFRSIGRGLSSPDDGLATASLGSGAGIFAILVHSVLDFNLQLPSNALLFFILVAILGQAVAGSRQPTRQLAQGQRTAPELSEATVRGLNSLTRR